MLCWQLKLPYTVSNFHHCDYKRQKSTRSQRQGSTTMEVKTECTWNASPKFKSKKCILAKWWVSTWVSIEVSLHRDSWWVEFSGVRTWSEFCYSSVISGRFLKLLEPQFLHLWNEGKNTHFVGWIG